MCDCRFRLFKPDNNENIISELKSKNTALAEQVTKLNKIISNIEPSYRQFKLNKNYEERDAILGIDSDWNTHSTQNFKNIDTSIVQKLIDQRFLDPSEKQNNSPSAMAVALFMKANPKVLASGYAVSPKREDYRVTINALSVSRKDVSDILLVSMSHLCSSADEISHEQGIYCWWD